MTLASMESTWSTVLENRAETSRRRPRHMMMRATMNQHHECHESQQNLASISSGGASRAHAPATPNTNPSTRRRERKAIVQQRRHQRRELHIFYICLTFCFLASSVSGFTVSAAASSPINSIAGPDLPSKKSRRTQTTSGTTTKLNVSSAYSGNGLGILASSAVLGGCTNHKSQHHDHNLNSHSGRMSRLRQRTKGAVSKLFPVKQEEKQQQLQQQEADDYERRKQEWADRYTNVDSLRKTFGSNRNKLWGDLDATTTRRLYKTLLPKALLEMLQVGVKPQDLAPLAYQARVAAKLYARERSIVPARYLAVGYDGLRQLRRYGKFQPSGMTYPQVWDKYEQLILEEEDDDDLSEEDVTSKICLLILEKSCSTNEGIDRMLLPSSSTLSSCSSLSSSSSLRSKQRDAKDHESDLSTAIQRLEREVHELLQAERQTDNYRASRIRTLRLLVRAKQRLDRWNHPLGSPHAEQHHHQKQQQHHHDNDDDGDAAAAHTVKSSQRDENKSGNES